MFIFSLYTINSTIQFILTYLLETARGQCWGSIFFPLSVFYFNRTYLFTQYYETTNKQIYKFSNYRIAKIVPKLSYIRPFNRHRHLVRLMSKELWLLNFKKLKTKFTKLIFNLLFNKNTLFGNTFLHSIQVKVFLQNKGTLYLSKFVSIV